MGETTSGALNPQHPHWVAIVIFAHRLKTKASKKISRDRVLRVMRHEDFLTIRQSPQLGHNRFGHDLTNAFGLKMMIDHQVDQFISARNGSNQLFILVWRTVSNHADSGFGFARMDQTKNDLRVVQRPLMPIPRVVDPAALRIASINVLQIATVGDGDGSKLDLHWDTLRDPFGLFVRQRLEFFAGR